MLMMQPTQGGHLFGGDPNVESLQRALTNLAIASGRPAINPGAISGTLNDATMAAVSASLGFITEELPSWLYVALQAALVLGSTTSQAKTAVTKYAGQLAMAANAAAAKMHPAGGIDVAYQPPPTVVQPMTSTFSPFAPGWYKTPFGIALILLVGFGVYKLFLAKPSRAVSAA